MTFPADQYYNPKMALLLCNLQEVVAIASHHYGLNLACMFKRSGVRRCHWDDVAKFYYRVAFDL
jgi:hypothetical protein